MKDLVCETSSPQLTSIFHLPWANNWRWAQNFHNISRIDKSDLSRDIRPIFLEIKITFKEVINMELSHKSHKSHKKPCIMLNENWWKTFTQTIQYFFPRLSVLITRNVFEEVADTKRQLNFEQWFSNWRNWFIWNVDDEKDKIFNWTVIRFKSLSDHIVQSYIEEMKSKENDGINVHKI